MKIVVIVEAEVPAGVSAKEWVDYVRAEVRANVGSRHPSDSLFDLDRASVKVRVVKNNRLQRPKTRL